jgi:hypothetical protein
MLKEWQPAELHGSKKKKPKKQNYLKGLQKMERRVHLKIGPVKANLFQHYG